MDIYKATYLTKGQGLVEYALIALGIPLAVILILNITGTSIAELYCQVIINVGGSGCGYSSTFEEETAQDDLDCWKMEDYMAIEDGKACLAPTNDFYLNQCSVDFGSADFSMDLKGISFAGGKKKNPELHIAFRAQDEMNGYYFSYNPKTNNIRFWKLVERKRISLGKTKVPKEWSSQDLDLQIEVKDVTFTVYKDGDQILTVQDNAYSEGQFGIRNKQSQEICIGEMTVQQLP